MSKVASRSGLDAWEHRYLPDPALPAGLASSGSATSHVHVLVRELGRWLDSDLPDPDDALREAFLGLSQVLRNRGLSTPATLEAMTALEEVLTSRDAERTEGIPPREVRLRLALRGMLLDAVRMNTELDARRARERSDALAVFSEVLGHEIANRLGAARTASQLLQDETVSLSEERRSALVRLIGEGVDATLASVDDVSALMMAQSRQGGDRLALGVLLEGVVRILLPLARKEGIRLEIDGEPPDLLVDAARVRLVVTNLAMNAVRYSDPAKEERWVRLRGEADLEEFRIEVRDNGIGIAPEDRDSIFRYRVRADGGRRHSREGSGLGLAVVAEAVSQMEGAVHVESRVGEGSSFRIHLPRSRA